MEGVEMTWKGGEERYGMKRKEPNMPRCSGDGKRGKGCL